MKSIMYFFERGLSAGASFIVSVTMVKWMAGKEYEAYQLMIGYLSVIVSLTYMIPASTVYAKYSKSNKSVLVEIFIKRLIMALPAFVVLLLILINDEVISKRLDFKYVLMVCLWLLLQEPLSTIRQKAEFKGNSFWGMIIRLTSPSVKLVYILIFFAFFDGFGLRDVSVMLIIDIFAVSIISLLFLSFSKSAWHYNLKFNGISLKDFKLGFMFVLISALQQMILRVDRMALAKIGDEVENAGLYIVFAGLSDNIIPLMYLIMTAYLVGVSSMDSCDKCFSLLLKYLMKKKYEITVAVFLYLIASISIVYYTDGLRNFRASYFIFSIGSCLGAVIFSIGIAYFGCRIKNGIKKNDFISICCGLIVAISLTAFGIYLGNAYFLYTSPFSMVFAVYMSEKLNA